MSFIVRMPKLSPTMEMGTIAKWHVKEGEVLKSGSVMMEVATDKATVEHEALDGGIVRKILIATGEEAEVNQAIAIVSAKADDDIQALFAEVEKEKQKPVTATPIPSSDESQASLASTKSHIAKTSQGSGFMAPAFQAAGVVDGYKHPGGALAGDRGIKASPYAKKLASERGIDLAGAKGTGPDGRVVAKDLESMPPANAWGVHFHEGSTPQLPPGSFELEALSPMRKAIATRLSQAKTFIPHFYLSQEVDAKALVAIQSQLKAQGIKLSINDFLVRATALALRQHPKVNSGFDSVEGKIIRFKTIDVAVAVALESGLMTPILFHADHKNVGALSQEIRQLAARAAAGKLEAYEYQGGSFTISNLGMFGVDQFQAIINPPQAAILAVGGAMEKPVVRAGKLEAGLVMTLTLSCDHRVIDGADAAKFLASLKQLIEAPSILLI